MKNKKQSLIVIIFILISALLFHSFFPLSSTHSMGKRATWISYIDLSHLHYDSKKAFKKDYEEIVKINKQYHINTLIVQVRSFSDSLYPSKQYPFSKIITNKKKLSFDPLKEMIAITHKNNMNFEAWINPYRISTNASSYLQFKQSKLGSWLNDSKLTIKYDEYKYILNPGSNKARQLIVSGIKEVINNYDVDGIHFDDYFYVDGTQKNVAINQRLDNVNELIQDVYQTIKKKDKNIEFGISPQGNYENCIAQGADIDLWLKEDGYIDYLMPQIYWTNHYGTNGKTKMFSTRANLFRKKHKNKKVALYAGLALYNAYEKPKIDKGWSQSSTNIKDQISLLEKYGYQGYALFRYEYLLCEEGKKEMEVLR